MHKYLIIHNLYHHTCICHIVTCDINKYVTMSTMHEESIESVMKRSKGIRKGNRCDVH